MRRSAAALAVAAAVQIASATAVTLPNRPHSVKFAVLGDFGTGDQVEYDIAAQMTAFHTRFPFSFVITTGDNIVGTQNEPADFAGKFERPFQDLLAAGVRFYASLGNHDKPSNRTYPHWNMNGRLYYTFAVENVRFFALDSNRPDRAELAWMSDVMSRSSETWKICYFHHPLYSDGVQHGPSLELRVLWEPLFVRYGVDVALSGHDHVYERFTSQRGVYYFVTGAGGQEPRALRRSAATAAAFERDQTFTAIEVAGTDLFFQTISRPGVTVDAGVIQKSVQASTGSGR